MCFALLLLFFRVLINWIVSHTIAEPQKSDIYCFYTSFSVFPSLFLFFALCTSFAYIEMNTLKFSIAATTAQRQHSVQHQSHGKWCVCKSYSMGCILCFMVIWQFSFRCTPRETLCLHFIRIIIVGNSMRTKRRYISRILLFLSEKRVSLFQVFTECLQQHCVLCVSDAVSFFMVCFVYLFIEWGGKIT